MGLSVIHPERLNFDNHAAGFWLRIGKLLNHQLLRITVLLYDNRSHASLLDYSGVALAGVRTYRRNDPAL